MELIIVARGDRGLYEDLSAKFAASGVRVILDRRAPGGSVPRPPGSERRAGDVAAELTLFGFAFAEPALAAALAR